MNLRTAIVAVLALYLVSNAVAAPSTVAASAAHGVRTLTTTARQLLIDVPKPNREIGDTEAFAAFKSRRRCLVNACKRLVAEEQVPTAGQLRKLREAITAMHGAGSAAAMYRTGSVENAAFAANLAMAQGYLDCALLMVGDVK